MARAVGLLITLCAISLFLTGVSLLDQLELKTYDMRLRALERTPPRHVTIAAIDEQSLARLGRWPWSRTTFAQLAERLDQLGARAIAFDLFFPERESAKADASFARAIGATKKVVLGTVFLLDRDEVRHLGPTGLEVAGRAIAPQAIADVRSSGEAEAIFPMQEPQGVIVNIPELQASAAFAGHINVLPDADGVVRRAPLVVRYNGQYFPAFDVQAARAYLGSEGPTLEVAAYGIAGLRIGPRYIPLDEDGRLLVRYRRPGSFDTLPIADILDRRADAALLRGRIVLVGNTAKGIGDVRVTPYGATLPGVEVRASIIESLLEGEVLQRPEWMTVVDVATMAAIGLLLIALLPRLGVTGGGILAAAVLGGYLFAATAVFRTEGLWLNIVYPSLLVALLFASATLVRYFFAVSEKHYLKVAFQHYVPPAVVDGLVSGAGELRLGGEKRELTVLFSDIRGFTAMSEAMTPEDLVKLMNEYFTAMTEKVFEQRGSLDKYIGDAIMAVYGAPVAEPQHAALACRTALGMVRALHELQPGWRREGVPPIDIGVGINTGPMIVGNMGSASRFNYTVVGDAVNLASRIESLNKAYGTNILLSEHTYQRVKDEFPLAREIDSVRVRGRTRQVRLYELIAEGRYPTLDWLAEFAAAYAAMREGDTRRAAGLFDALYARVGDPVSAYHARAIRRESGRAPLPA